MNSEQIIGWMIAGCILFIVFMIFSKPAKLLAKLCLNGILGVSALFIGNFILAPTGFAVGINLFTAVFTAVLGIPGVLCLYFFKFII